MQDSPLNFSRLRVPFLYSTNGELIWFHDVRRDLKRSRPIRRFHTPNALREMLARDADTACARLEALPNDHPWLRPYQKEATAAVEKAIADSKRQMLVAMATGTGKTVTLVNQSYRLLQSGMARRILFLVSSGTSSSARASSAGGMRSAVTGVCVARVGLDPCPVRFRRSWRSWCGRFAIVLPSPCPIYTAVVGDSAAIRATVCGCQGRPVRDRMPAASRAAAIWRPADTPQLDDQGDGALFVGVDNYAAVVEMEAVGGVPADPLPLRLLVLHRGAGPLSDHVTLELGEHGQNAEDHVAF